MPKYMDTHDMPGVTAELAAAAHAQDVAVQNKHGVKFTKYWFDENTGKVFCLSEAPNAEASLAVHAEAGHPPVEIFEVNEGQ